MTDGTVLIIGGTGQIGREAARRLADDGWDVTVASRRKPEDSIFGVTWSWCCSKHLSCAPRSSAPAPSMDHARRIRASGIS